MSSARNIFLEKARKKSLLARRKRQKAEQAELAERKRKEDAKEAKKARRLDKKAKERKKSERARLQMAQERGKLRALLLPAGIDSKIFGATNPIKTDTQPQAPYRNLLLSPLPDNKFVTKLVKCVDGGWYVGQFQKTSKGVPYRHGFGFRFYKDGSLLYRGYYKMSQFQGYGERFSQGGQCMHRGMFANDLPHGNGRGWDLENRYSFDGMWNKGMPLGHGSLYGPKSSKKPYYVGMVKGWKPSGYGIIYAQLGEDVDGVTHQGEFLEGKRDGQGVGVWPLPQKHPCVNESRQAEYPQDHKPMDSDGENNVDTIIDSESTSDVESMRASDELCLNCQQDEFSAVEMHTEVPGLQLEDSSSVSSGSRPRNAQRRNQGKASSDCREKAKFTRESRMRYATFRFRGQWKRNKPCGKGVLIDAFGRVRFEGTWDDQGLRQGPGIQTFADGATFEGSWLNDLAHGPGVWKGGNGASLRCTWSKGQRCGHGDWKGSYGGTKLSKDTPEKPISDVKRLGSTLSSLSRASHVGEWRDGAMNGPGEWWGQDGSHYVGSFKNNKKHGEGTLRNADGTFLKGRFKEGQLDGIANLYRSQGDLLPIYRGPFKNGKFHGDNGVYRYEDGCVYEGQWKNGARHGHGTFRTKNGIAAYEGSWKTDMMHGSGLARILGGIFKGCIYKGTFVNGKKETIDATQPGEISDKSGKLLYRGLWKDDLFHHKDKTNFAEWFHPESGESYVGCFQKGARHGFGTYIFEDGRKYVGEWFEGEMQGKGRLKHPDGLIEEGTFRGNRLHETDDQHYSRMCYELVLDWLSEDIASDMHIEAVAYARAEAARKAREEWEREDPEYEARKKIERMRLDKLRQLNERRLEEERRKRMMGAIRVRERRKQKQSERRLRDEQRVFLAALKA